MNEEHKLDYIATKVSFESRLIQVAEESAELAQAAVKLVRIKRGDNPSPLPVNQAADNVIEEIADVKNAIAALRIDNLIPTDELEEQRQEKLDRWYKRIRGEKK